MDNIDGSTHYIDGYDIPTTTFFVTKICVFNTNMDNIFFYVLRDYLDRSRGFVSFFNTFIDKI